jgi:hypothetical protein
MTTLSLVTSYQMSERRGLTTRHARKARSEERQQQVEELS